MWLCSQYEKLRCKGRIVTYGSTTGRTVKITSEHNHPALYPDVSRAVCKLVKLVKNTSSDEKFTLCSE